MRVRAGFTLIELLIVLLIAGTMLATTATEISRSLAKTGMQRAASTVAADLQLGQSLAARQRRPVRVSIDTVQKVLRIRDQATPAKTYSERHFGARGDHPVTRLLVSDTSLVIYPSGLVSSQLSIQLFAGPGHRRVTMSRAGQVRILGS